MMRAASRPRVLETVYASFIAAPPHHLPPFPYTTLSKSPEETQSQTPDPPLKPTLISTMLKLQCKAQNYDWGIQGSTSTVGRLYALGSGEPVVEETKYAELWMGTHPSGPSKVIGDGTVSLLKDWLAEHPKALGDKVASKWKGDLPFLFKVLSVAKALSIQAHPDKPLAERLHKEQPLNYKDDNHKPEMALAVTPFEALCAFVTMEELKESLATVPELRAIVGEAASSAVASLPASPSEEERKAALRSAFTALMTSDKEAVAAQLSNLIVRLEAEKKSRTLSPKEEVILRTEKQYPADVGIFAIYFLNYLTLGVGEAIYLAANEPHAYLLGECIECMAASDNVVRAGLTPKYRDTDNLCSMLTYNQGLPKILKGDRVDKYTSVYTPPFDEFEVERILVPLGETYSSFKLAGPSILLVFKGQGLATYSSAADADVKQSTALKVGEIFFVPAEMVVHLSAVVETEGPQREVLELYRARVNATKL
eukprot:TRINITY_DN35911_c0_g1_i1.p1 TRINITY_DN35911_c0_g1~~TRINITY_DN35911_c0_g1_i1.p1  ORF type:complete len:482 (-),score=87.42 TRINITY_DN35911_c0_g1_i1:1259-2704(-)